MADPDVPVRGMCRGAHHTTGHVMLQHQALHMLPRERVWFWGEEVWQKMQNRGPGRGGGGNLLHHPQHTFQNKRLQRVIEAKHLADCNSPFVTNLVPCTTKSHHARLDRSLPTLAVFVCACTLMHACVCVCAWENPYLGGTQAWVSGISICTGSLGIPGLAAVMPENQDPWA